MTQDNTSLPLEGKTLNLFGIPINRQIVTGQKNAPWSAVFILSLVWFTWGFHIFAGGLALTFTINKYTNDPRIIAFVQNINVIIMLGPFISYISDQVWTRIGRRRPFLIVAWAASCIAMYCFAFLPTVTTTMNGLLTSIGIPPITEFILLIGVICGYTTMYDLQAPIEPLFLECVPPHQRGRFFAVRGMLFQCAVLFFFQVLWPVYHEQVDISALGGLFSASPSLSGLLSSNDAWHFRGEQLIYIIAGTLFLLTGIFLLFGIHERPDPKAPNKRFRDVFLGDKSLKLAPRTYPVVAPDAPGWHWLHLAGIGLILNLLYLGYCIATGPNTTWNITHFVLLLLGLHAALSFYRRRPIAPASAIIFFGVRLFAVVVLLAIFMLFYKDPPTDYVLMHMWIAAILVALYVPYFVRSRIAAAHFRADVMADLYRIPIVSFMVSYLKDVFLNWSNYPFYIVLVIPGIEQTVWGNFGNIMQSKQFGYSMANQAFWGFPMTLLGIVLLTPFSGWYSDLKAGGAWRVPPLLVAAWGSLTFIILWFIINGMMAGVFSGLADAPSVEFTGVSTSILIAGILLCILVAKVVGRWLSGLTLNRFGIIIFRQLILIAGLFMLAGAWWFYRNYAPEDIRELPIWWATFAVAILAAIGCMLVLVYLIENLLAIVGHTHARAWASMLAVILGLAVNVVMYSAMRAAPNQTIPITLFMILNVMNGAFGSLLGTFVGPMIYEYMPRSKMGTINAGRGLMGDGLRWMINNLGGWWIFWYSKRVLYPDQPEISAEEMNYDYTSMYLLMFVLFIPVLAAQGWFLRQVVTGRIQRWGVLEVEGEENPETGERA